MLQAFTASATAEVRQDILQILGIRKGEYAQWVEPCNRKNLFYEVRKLALPAKN
jgi:bloom syndrome protein